MSHDRHAELGPDPEALREKYCRACGELRPVRTQRDEFGTERYFCAMCGAELGEEAADSLDEPDLGFPDA